MLVVAAIEKLAGGHQRWRKSRAEEGLLALVSQGTEANLIFETKSRVWGGHGPGWTSVVFNESVANH